MLSGYKYKDHKMKPGLQTSSVVYPPHFEEGLDSRGRQLGAYVRFFETSEMLYFF